MTENVTQKLDKVIRIDEDQRPLSQDTLSRVGCKGAVCSLLEDQWNPVSGR